MADAAGALMNGESRNPATSSTTSSDDTVIKALVAAISDLRRGGFHDSALALTYSIDLLRSRSESAKQIWQPMETAPKGDGKKDYPRILLRFGDEAVSVAYWDMYYAEGGSGYRNGFAWVEPCSGETLDLHYTTPPDGWMPMPTDGERPEGKS